ncbi:bifunctional glutamate N-acetyltransferase/amino-acid acetyltransferase ArgJ [Chloroflexota bacterium]
MEAEIEFIPSGTVTSPEGFHAGGTYAGIKEESDEALDLGILFSEAPCVAAAVFTKNRIKAAPVILTRRRLRSGRALAVVINSGCANACTGKRGFKDAVKIAELAAKGLGILPKDVLVSSTGLIGKRLPMRRIQDSIDQIILSRDGGYRLTRAIMTTDTMAKETAVAVEAAESRFTIGGIAKGSGMIHPDMATLLCFLATDAAVDIGYLKSALKRAVDNSFNMVSIDGDTSPNDTVLIMANGMAGNKPITKHSELAGAFQQALDQVCVSLAKYVARDGEGASKLIEVTVAGAPNTAQARLAARAVVSSPLLKAAVHGSDPNWGRVMAAVGRSGAKVIEAKMDLYLGDICVVRAGQPLPFNKRSLKRTFSGSEVPITIQLNLGTATATAWGCDLSEEYVTINSDYTT